MANLLKTESRLPEIYPEGTGLPVNYFNPSNANLLGYNQFDTDYCLISYLPAKVIAVKPYGNFQNHYVVFINDTPGTVYEFFWSIDYLFETGASVSSLHYDEPLANQQTARFEVDAIKQGVDENDLTYLKEVITQCVVKSGGVTVSTLSLKHKIGQPYTDLDALYNAPTDGDNIAKGGSPEVTQLTANLYRGYTIFDPKWIGKHTNNPPLDPPVMPTVDFGGVGELPPLYFPVSLMYSRLNKTNVKGGRKDYFPPLNEDYYADINGGGVQLYKQEAKNLVGVSAITPHLAAIALGKTSFQRIGAGGVTEETLFTAFESLTEDEKIDIYNFCRFPRSAFLLSALLLKKLIDEAVTNSHAQFKASAANISSWNSNLTDALKNDKYVKNLMFEYINGPQDDIGGVEYWLGYRKFRKLIDKVHKHDYAPYVKLLVDNHSTHVQGTLPEINASYFARKKITIDGSGNKNVAFERVDASVLGQAEYIVIKTKNLQGQELNCKVKTGDTTLTGTANETLTLVNKSGAGTSEYLITVGDTTELVDEENNAFANASDFDDYAIFFVGLRSDNETTLNTWNANLAGSSSRLVLEMKMETPAPGQMIFYGASVPGIAPEDATTSVHTSLGIGETPFVVSELIKSGAPRIVDAYFAKRKITSTNAGVLAVSFERIPEVAVNGDPASWTLGRSVYMIVETENMHGQDIYCTVRAGDDNLYGTGTAHQTLPLAPLIEDPDTPGSFLQPEFFTANPIYDNPVDTWLNTLALNDNDSWVLNTDDPYNPNNPNGAVQNYTNMSTLENKAIVKLNLRPNEPVSGATTARDIFNIWTGNIDTGTAEIQIEVRASKTNGGGTDQYVYYGDEQWDELAYYDGNKVFLDQPGSKFTVQNRTFFEIYHSGNDFNVLSDNPATTNQRRIAKMINNDADEVTYFYFDELGNEHQICSSTLHSGVGKNNGTRLTNVAEALRNSMILAMCTYNVDNAITDPDYNASNAIYVANAGAPLALTVQSIIDYRDYEDEGVDAKISYVFPAGTVTIGNTATYPDRYYTNTGTFEYINAEFIETPLPPGGATLHTIFPELNYVNTDGDAEGDGTDGIGVVQIAYGFRQTRRRSVEPNFFAAFLGGLGQANYDDIVSGGFSYSDGTCFPSVSHASGKAVDTAYMTTRDGVDRLVRQNVLANGWWDLGIRPGHGRPAGGWKASIAHSRYLAQHEDHLHTGGHADGYDATNNIEFILPE